MECWDLIAFLWQPEVYDVITKIFCKTLSPRLILIEKIFLGKIFLGNIPWYITSRVEEKNCLYSLTIFSLLFTLICYFYFKSVIPHLNSCFQKEYNVFTQYLCCVSDIILGTGNTKAD